MITVAATENFDDVDGGTTSNVNVSKYSKRR